MPTIKVTRADLRDPQYSEVTLVRGEDAAHCEGGVCRELFRVGDEESGPGPHHHLVVSGEIPTASPRYYAVKSRR